MIAHWEVQGLARRYYTPAYFGQPKPKSFTLLYGAEKIREVIRPLSVSIYRAQFPTQCSCPIDDIGLNFILQELYIGDLRWVHLNTFIANSSLLLYDTQKKRLVLNWPSRRTVNENMIIIPAVRLASRGPPTAPPPGPGSPTVPPDSSVCTSLNFRRASMKYELT